MQIQQIVLLLREIQTALEPFTRAIIPGALVWDGSKYTATSTSSTPDPFACTWWATIRTIADMLDAQNMPITNNQQTYLQKVLFGGMGSLADYQIDEKRWGAAGKAANQNIENKRQLLFQELK